MVESWNRAAFASTQFLEYGPCTFGDFASSTKLNEYYEIYSVADTTESASRRGYLDHSNSEALGQ